jgi:hypothetical protein
MINNNILFTSEASALAFARWLSRRDEITKIIVQVCNARMVFVCF